MTSLLVGFCWKFSSQVTALGARSYVKKPLMASLKKQPFWSLYFKEFGKSVLRIAGGLSGFHVLYHVSRLYIYIYIESWKYILVLLYLSETKFSLMIISTDYCNMSCELICILKCSISVMPPNMHCNIFFSSSDQAAQRGPSLEFVLAWWQAAGWNVTCFKASWLFTSRAQMLIWPQQGYAAKVAK